ncbi:MAG: hypothetical protein WDN25_10205 [Acetobacteraceae bacterium]
MAFTALSPAVRRAAMARRPMLLPRAPRGATMRALPRALPRALARALAGLGGLLLMLAAAPPAAALEACFAASVGPWRGPVINDSRVQVVETEFELSADGTLVGHYHVEDAEPFDGSLTGFHQTAPCEADFTWTDRYGTGIVHIRFEPELGRFLGYWGLEEPIPMLIFRGYRTRPPNIS